MGILKKECPICGYLLGVVRFTFLKNGSYRIKCSRCHNVIFVIPEDAIKGKSNVFNPSERFAEIDKKREETRKGNTSVSVRP